MKRHVRWVGAAVAALVVGALASVPTSAVAREIVTPGSFTGYGFDACTAPDQELMDTWWASSPFTAVGIYVAGASRSCEQPNLTPEWVATQAQTGWRFMPIYLGRQAPCNGRPPKIGWDEAVAEQQGKDAADEMVAASRALGISKGSVLYDDIENYPVDKARCNDAVLSFVSGWTKRVRFRGYVSGMYSSASGGIAAVDTARIEEPGAYRLPDQIWFGWSNGMANTDSEPYASNDGWSSHQRIHQYDLDTTATYGGVSLNIDRDWLDVGRGSFARRETGDCGREVDFGHYNVRNRGDAGPQVAALQCRLNKAGYFPAQVSGKFGGPTESAVKAYQTAFGLAVTGSMTRRTWVSLLAQGGQPLVKFGSNQQAVYRLQRSLTAALGIDVAKTGVFDTATVRAVRTYERSQHQAPNGVAGPEVWDRLDLGLIAR